MATSYPASLDNFTNPSGSDTLASPDHAGQHTDINDAVEAIETELGTLPKGSSASVKARLDAVDVDVASRIPALPYRAGAFYRTPTTAGNGLATYAVNTSYYIPFYVTMAETFDRMQIQASASFLGSASIRLGIYNNSAGVPSTVLLDAGTVAPVAASTGYSVTISQALSVGYYWLAFNTVTAATTNSFTSNGAVVWNVMNLGSTSAGTNYAVGYSEAVNATSGFATAGTLATVTIAPIVALRAT
jgi:hypothetical protein